MTTSTVKQVFSSISSTKEFLVPGSTLFEQKIEAHFKNTFDTVKRSLIKVSSDSELFSP